MSCQPSWAPCWHFLAAILGSRSLPVSHIGVSSLPVSHIGVEVGQGLIQSAILEFELMRPHFLSTILGSRSLPVSHVGVKVECDLTSYQPSWVQRHFLSAILGAMLDPSWAPCWILGLKLNVTSLPVSHLGVKVTSCQPSWGPSWGQGRICPIVPPPNY